MRRLFFSLVFYLSILAIAAGTEGFSKPKPRRWRPRRPARILFVKCKSELAVCENKITELNRSFDFKSFSESLANSTLTISECLSKHCLTGFHYDSDHCQQNICTCQNGMAITGTKCETHQQEKCDPLKCHEGFHYDSNLCVPNICTCQNGEPKTGVNCVHHGKEDCTFTGCNKGFHYSANDSGHCKPNICNTGFYYHSNSCLENPSKVYLMENDWKQAGDTSVYFKLLDHRMELAEAHIACQAAYPGSRLATILSQTEFDLIKGFRPKTIGRQWVDLKATGDIGDRSNWYWGNGIVANQNDDWWVLSGRTNRYAPWCCEYYHEKEGVFDENRGLHNHAYPKRNFQNPAICELRL